MWFHAGFIIILRLHLLRKQNTVWKMEGYLLESMRNKFFSTLLTLLYRVGGTERS